MSCPLARPPSCTFSGALPPAFDQDRIRPYTPRQNHPVAWFTTILSLLGFAIAGSAALARQTDYPIADDPVRARLGFIESLYGEGDDFRAESEILAFLHEFPDSPLRPQAELVRAKLYYREQRYADADVMLLFLIDRNRDAPASRDARNLLGFSWLREGRVSEAVPLLNREPSLTPLLEPPPYDADRAVAWSTVLPGSGFFTLGEPARGVTALSLNALFIAGAAISYDQHNVPAALIFLIVEGAFYAGGRTAVREEAARLNDGWMAQRRDAWLSQSSEPRLMATAFEKKF
jgi:hypothetical protein